MIIAPSAAPTEQLSKALKSVWHYLGTMVAKQETASFDHDCSASGWDVFLGEDLPQSAPFSEEAHERWAAIAQIMNSADVGTKTSIADCLLFTDDINEAHKAIIMRGRRAAA